MPMRSVSQKRTRSFEWVTAFAGRMERSCIGVPRVARGASGRDRLRRGRWRLNSGLLGPSPGRPERARARRDVEDPARSAPHRSLRIVDALERADAARALVFTRAQVAVRVL